VSSEYIPPSATNILPANAIPVTLFPTQPFCSSAHTFHRATRSHQAGSCHRAPSKDDDFSFLGNVVQMPENTEPKKISLLTIASRQQGKFSSAPLQERASISRSVSAYGGLEKCYLKTC
jgi:hypothetical protein